MSVNNLLNFFEESVVGGYSTTDTAIEISDASRLDTFPYSAVIFDIADKSPVEAYKNNRAEIVNITGKSGNTTTVERGQEGTTAITLEAGRNYAIHVALTANIGGQINQAVTDAEIAATAALANMGVDENFISWDNTLPDSTGAETGTKGAYFKDNELYQVVEWDGSVWQEIGLPVTTKTYVDDKASLLLERIEAIEDVLKISEEEEEEEVETDLIYLGYITEAQGELITEDVANGTTHPTQVLELDSAVNHASFPDIVNCEWKNEFGAMDEFGIYTQFLAIPVDTLTANYAYYQNIDFETSKGDYATKGVIEDLTIDGKNYRVFKLDETSPLNYRLSITSL